MLFSIPLIPVFVIFGSVVITWYLTKSKGLAYRIRYTAKAFIVSTVICALAAFIAIIRVPSKEFTWFDFQFKLQPLPNQTAGQPDMFMEKTEEGYVIYIKNNNESSSRRLFISNKILESGPVIVEQNSESGNAFISGWNRQYLYPNWVYQLLFPRPFDFHPIKLEVYIRIPRGTIKKISIYPLNIRHNGHLKRWPLFFSL